jgi:hypothetical protein
MATYFSLLPENMLQVEFFKHMDAFSAVKYCIMQGDFEAAAHADLNLYGEYRVFFKEMLAFDRIVFKGNAKLEDLLKSYVPAYNIQELYCGSMRQTCKHKMCLFGMMWPPLPGCVIFYGRGRHIRYLPNLLQCRILYCNDSHLTTTPYLPNCVKLFVNNNQLKLMGMLPRCEILHCGHNPELKILPDLSSCVELDCTSNQIEALPALAACATLVCNDNRLTALPSLDACVSLECRNNNLLALPALGEGQNIDCRDNPNIVIIRNTINKNCKIIC